jgi:hypothetical protein
MSQEAGALGPPSTDGRIGPLLALGAAAICAAVLALGLLVEWKLARPHVWLPPQNKFEYGWAGLLVGLSAVVALCVAQRRGLLLLRATAVCVGLCLLLSLVRPRTALAYLGLLWLLTLAVGQGYAVLRRLCPGVALTLLERLLLATALGYGLLSQLTLALALVGWLSPWIVFPTLALLTLACAPALANLAREVRASSRAALRRWREADLRLPAVVLTLLAICFLSCLVWALADEIGYDSMMYHLAYPLHYIKHGGLVERADGVHSHFCHNAEMLFTLALLTVGQPLPQLIHLSAGLLVVGLVFCLGRRLGGPHVGWVASLLFYALPLVSWQSGTAYNDLLITLFVLSGVTAAAVWVRSHGRGLLPLAGAFVGLAVGIKISCLLCVVPLLGLLAGVIAVRRCSGRERLREMLALGLPFLLCACPWFLIEWARTGNPVFPFYNAFFQSPMWRPVNEGFDHGTFGMGCNLQALLMLPWNVTCHPNRFDNFGWGMLEGLALAAVPFTMGLWPRKGRGSARLLLALVLVSCLLWFVRVQYVRYLLPLVPVLAVFAAMNVRIAWSALAEGTRRPGWAAALVLLAGLAWFSGTRWWHLRWIGQIPERFPVRLAVGLESSEHFLQRAVPQYDALRFLAREAEHGPVRVLEYPMHHRLYGGDCEFYHALFIPFRYDPLTMSAGEGLARNLEENGITYLLLNRKYDSTLPPDLEKGITDPGFLRRYCRKVLVRRSAYLNKEVVLYRFLGAQGRGPSEEGAGTSPNAE